ncbi:MAG: diacylglycerol kinase family lipid kinase [Verrucomicrobiae bacterium]|nr:diacylglycerol kinase family lipid kinase [Verrucomicrobiae bacterium]
MSNKFYIIANPLAGKKSAPTLAVQVLEALKSNGAVAELVLTASRQKTTELIGQIESPDNVIVACGGDGTIQDVVNGLKTPDTILGVIPGGRCNDFARAIGVYGIDDADMYAKILLNGKTKNFDYGIINGRKFLTVATFGFDSEVSRFVESHKLILKGTSAYLYGVFRILFDYQFARIKLSGDFGAVEDKVLLVATANTPFYGGAMKIAPSATPDDGCFDVCMVKEVSKFTVLRMLLRVFKGTHITHPAVRIFKTRELKIETPYANHWICADGESIARTPCIVKIQPGALKVIVP